MKTVRIDIPCQHGQSVKNVEARPTSVKGLFITPYSPWDGKNLKEGVYTITAMPSGLGLGVYFTNQRVARMVAAVIGALFPDVAEWTCTQAGKLGEVPWLRAWLLSFPK